MLPTLRSLPVRAPSLVLRSISVRFSSPSTPLLLPLCSSFFSRSVSSRPDYTKDNSKGLPTPYRKGLPGVKFDINSADVNQDSSSIIALKAHIMHEVWDSFRQSGHLLANTDPLRSWLDNIIHMPQKNMQQVSVQKLVVAMKNYPHTIDLSPFIPSWHPGMTLDFRFHENEFALISRYGQVMTPRQLIDFLLPIFCSTISAEFLHLQTAEEVEWVQTMLERGPTFDKQAKINLYRDLYAATSVEQKLARTFPSVKRFGLEGCDSLIPGLRALVNEAADLGVRTINIGMPHRGRLNVLANVMGKPLGAIFNEFDHSKLSKFHVGDVKYHLGHSSVFEAQSGDLVNISMNANPSHLEQVDPVALGYCHGLQIADRQLYGEGSAGDNATLGVLLHGDAAFCGQGIVAETFQLSRLQKYSTSGTVHLVINNQVAFTTSPGQYMSSAHPTDMGKIIGAPIFHCNADDPEAVAYACQLGIQFRQRFCKDAVVDVVGYRRHGHNEQDDPLFTNPKLYKKISDHPPCHFLYAQRLQADGALTHLEIVAIQDEVNANIERDLARANEFLPSETETLERTIEKITISDKIRTGISQKRLDSLITAVTKAPPGSFKL